MDKHGRLSTDSDFIEERKSRQNSVVSSHGTNMRKKDASSESSFKATVVETPGKELIISEALEQRRSRTFRSGRDIIKDARVIA